MIRDRLVPFVAAVHVAAVIYLLVRSLNGEKLDPYLGTWTNLVVASATTIYAYLTYLIVRETKDTGAAMRAANEVSRRIYESQEKARKQAATPIVRILLYGIGQTIKCRITNDGTTPARDIRVELWHSHEQPPSFIQVASSVLGINERHDFDVNWNVLPIEKDTHEWVFVITYSNVFGDHFRSKTSHPKDQTALLPDLRSHRFDHEELK